MAVSVLLLKLAPHVEKEVNLILKSKEEADTLKSKLKKIQRGLHDAEMKGATDQSIKDWLKELEDIMYQMDDALDKWEMKKMELEIEQSEYDDITDHWEKVHSLLTRICSCSCFKHVVGRRELTLEMKALSARLDVMLKERGETYNFVSNKSDDNHKPKMHETTSFVDESEVVGRESDKDSIVQKLLSNHEKKGIQVISVVGKGGLGKTTFAQLVYNDDSVDKYFDLKAWVFVPNPFDALEIAQAILESFDKSNAKSKSYSLENLRQRIKSIVLERNFLLVLDNVWTVDSQEWESLRNILVGLPGCRILATTRDVTAAETMDTTRLLRLGDLPGEACATILNTIALAGRNAEAEHEQLKGIGSDIAKKCNGLPLAAKTIARMLKSRNTVHEWEVVRDSPMWRYEDEMGDTYNALRLSYADLSPIHKRCFLSFVLYPKGTVLRVDELIRLWMAQGYISSSVKWEEVQEQGMKFFKVLVNRCFFEELERDEGEDHITCKVHDVMHDLAVGLARSEYYFVVGNGTALQSAGRIHCYGVTNFLEGEISLPNFMSYLKCVRVLCLMKCDLEELPEEVSELIHLRYLDLSWSGMRELPETLCNLYNLQTLDLQGCGNLTRLPRSIEKLVKLKHLLLHRSCVSEYPRGFRKLTGLWTLDVFIATSDSIGYLENLNELTGSLRIAVVGENMEASEAEKANLKSKTRLVSLEYVFDEDVNKDVIDAMVPPPGLSSLSVEGEDNRLPSWITTVTNVKLLTISGSGDTWYSLPSLDKLPMLEKLCVRLMRFKRLGLMEFFGSGCGFSKLKTLRFQCCWLWEEWEDLKEEEDGGTDVYGMPCLEELEINQCSMLKALPHKLLSAAPRLRKLTIFNCDCLESRYRKDSGADREKISHIPCIDIIRGGTYGVDPVYL